MADCLQHDLMQPAKLGRLRVRPPASQGRLDVPLGHSGWCHTSKRVSIVLPGLVTSLMLQRNFPGFPISFRGMALTWVRAGVKEQVCNTMRLAAYAAERSNVVRALLQRMATLPEAVEIARVTGLTLGQVRQLTSLLLPPGP